MLKVIPWQTLFNSLLLLKEKEYIKKYNSQVEGYNVQHGGYNNSQGEGNGRALLTEADVVFIRTAYQNHESPKEIFEKYFSKKITKNNFQSVWQGRTWVNIMPEVYTEENKKYYISGQQKAKSSLSKEEVLSYRQYYVNHTREEVYQKILSEKGDILKKATFFKILVGDVRDNSIYKEIPVYKKSKKCWELNNEAVSTIPESGK